MASETDCLNDALGMIGAARITAISDGSINANHCLAFYPMLRDGLLRSHHWNFATTRTELALDVTAPVSGFAYAYTLPPDCLKVIDFGGALPVTTTTIQSNALYRIEGRALLCNYGTAFIVYLRRVTNPDEWDAIFYQALSLWLASKLAMAIPKDAKKSTALLGQAVDLLLPLAMAIDGQESSVEPFIVDDLTWGR